MSFSIAQPPLPRNEAVRDYRAGTPERTSLLNTLHHMSKNPVDIGIMIGGREIRTGQTVEVHSPHRHALRLGTYHQAQSTHVRDAVEAGHQARSAWEGLSWEDRAAIFLKAADLLAGPWRDRINAATMLCQSKTVHQAEIDAACEMADFWRFNVAFATQLYREQPQSPAGTWNRAEYRPLEGFVFAVTPFNFTSIAGNLPTAPALMGNTVIWKPASSVVYTAYWIMKLLEEAGLPPGVISMVPGSGGTIGDAVLAHPELAGVHFTGSTGVFQGMWKSIGQNIAQYRTYPRIVGETGGKDFVVAHASADARSLAIALLRGAFEFQGQKCSAASRAYVPDNLWKEVRQILADEVATIRMGDVSDTRNFMGAVIDQAAYERITGYQQDAAARGLTMVAGGKADRSEGWFVQPTVVQVQDPKDRLMQEEIFGPVLAVYVYPEKAFDETLEIVDTTSPYALTGAVFARDRTVIAKATQRLRQAAGNFYNNDKPTGAVVGQQPFGGARASGTNDKAGSLWNLIRWVSPRTIKETFSPPVQYGYPFMEEGSSTEAVMVGRS
jgi:1-pyrroline-5-carboxylate dehydrogenase